MTNDACPPNIQGDGPSAVLSKRDRATFLAQELKSNARSLIRKGDTPSSTPQDEFFDDLAFNPQRALEPTEPDKASVKDRLNIGAKTVVNALKNPKALGRNNYTRQAVAKIAKYPHDHSTRYDHELLEAHDAFTDAQERYGLQDGDYVSDDLENNADLATAQSRLEHIQQQRDDLKSGWILGRQVVRVKQVRQTQVKPVRSQFVKPANVEGGKQQLQLGPYLGHLLLWYTEPFTAHRIDDYDIPPFDFKELALTVERLAAVSTPWQTFLYELRQVYRWTDPLRTIRYMIPYWILWYLEHLTTFSVVLIIYKTLRNKSEPTRVHAIQERIKRSSENSEKVRAWGELIQKHGRSDWVEPFIDGVGPHLQIQLGDLSMFLERVQNFYWWEESRQTWLTLAFFSVVLLFLLLTSTAVCVKLTWFILGCCFFYGFPIATNYPKYRHLVSPLSWIFWVIPDAAELTILRLQRRSNTQDRIHQVQSRSSDELHTLNPAQAYRQDSMNTKSEREDTREPSEPLGTTPTAHFPHKLSFRTSVLPGHVSGTISLTRAGIEFDSKNGTSFSVTYTSILEIRKVNLNEKTSQSTSSENPNKLSRTAHITRSMERSTNTQLAPDGLEFIFQQKEHVSHSLPNQNFRLSHLEDRVSNLASDKQQVSVTFALNKMDRDKVFTVTLAWSGVQWQALYSMNRQNMTGQRRAGIGKGESAESGEEVNENLDDAIKRALA